MSSYAKGTGAAITVAPSGFTTSVGITRLSGTALTVYSNPACTSVVSMPSSITSATTYYVPDDDTYVVSLKVNAVECATVSGTAITAYLYGASIADYAVSEYAALRAGGTVTSAKYPDHTTAATVVPRPSLIDVRDYASAGNAAQQIQAALNAAVPGDVVRPQPGTYNITQTLLLPNYVNLVAPGTGTPFTTAVTFQADVALNADILTNAGVDTSDYWMHGSKIAGIQFKAATGQTSGSGIRVAMGENSTIRDCTFVSFPEAGVHFKHLSGGVQAACSLAPAFLHNICCYGNLYGVWCDWIRGDVTIFGITGDNNNSMVAITYPDANPNNGGRWTTVTVHGPKLESSTWNGGATSTSHDPIFLMNNPNGAMLNIIGGTATSATGDSGVKSIVKITNGYNGVNSTFDGNVQIDGFGANGYPWALTNTISGVNIPWPMRADDYPRYTRVAKINYRMREDHVSDASDPRGAFALVAPSYPMVKRSKVPLVGTLTAAITDTTRPKTITIDSTTAAALPASGTYTLYVEEEPLQVTAGQGTSSLTVAAIDPGGGYLAGTHANGAYVKYYPETWSISGTGSPLGTVNAPPGSEYARIDPSASTTTKYIKTSGWGNLGWERLQSFPPAYIVNDALTGTATPPAGWIAQAGTWVGTTGGASQTAANALAVLERDHAIADVTLQCDITLGAGTRGMAGLIMRGIDDSNYLRVTWDTAGQAILAKRDGGSFTTLATWGTSETLAATITAKAVCLGTSIKIYRNGTLVQSYTLTGGDATKFLSTTKFGVHENSFNDDLGTRFKNFQSQATSETAQGVGAMPVSVVQLAADGDYVVVDASVSPKTVKTVTPPTAAANQVYWLPSDLGYLHWNGDPANLVAGQVLTTAGTVYVAKLKTPSLPTVTNIEALIITAGNTLTTGQCFAALYDGTGTLLRQSVDQAVAWVTPGAVTMALSSAVAIPTTTCYVALWFNGTTGPAFARFSSGTNASPIINGKTPNTNGRWFTAGTGKTTTAPSPLSLTAYAQNSFFIGLT